MHRVLRPLSRKGQLACAVALCASLGLLSLILGPATAEGSSCPPGWTSCTGWSADGSCCVVLFYTLTTQARTCTTWDHDTNAYPTCTYKVVDRKTEIRCRSPHC